MKRAAIIYNEHAGQANDHLSIEQIKAQIESHDFQLKLCPTSKPGDGERIAKETGKDVDTLFIFGGDGTVHECINGIPSLQNRPNLAVLPGGTCNDFARTLGISMNLEEAIDQVCTGTTKTVDVPKMNDRYFLNFFAVGLIADTSENINEELKATIGRLSYFWSALQTVTNPTYYTYTLTSDDLHLTGEAL
ncbi:diacylglycerol kinase family protein [Geomicrobium sp. JCM 19055]|uniref:diacylglycerol/lipid kinase family protein n=1 Tax=Geomicrobium sp. JCM 19055 TaxID=1460649 RepID=UPI0006945DBD|nr:diacylglycerol kinase family protein [Geomicrobium sp. JCM 19055]